MTLDKQTSRRIIGIVAISLFMAWGVSHLNGVPKLFSIIFSTITPILMGVLIAFVVNLPMSWFEKKFFSKPWKKGDNYRNKLARPLSMLFAYSVFFVVIALMLTLAIPDLVNTIVSFVQQLPETFNKINSWYLNFSKDNPEVAGYIESTSFNINNLMNQLINWFYSAGSQIAQAVIGVVQGTIQGIFNFFIGLIFSFYFVVRKEVMFAEIKAIGYSLLPEKIMDKLSQLFSLTSLVFSKFFTGQALESLITGAMTFASMMIFGFSFPITITVFQMIGTFIPIVGALLSGVFGAILILVEDSLFKAFLFAILIVVIQQIEGNLIYPRVMGSQIGLPSFWVFVAVTVGTTLFGFVGALLSVPLTTVVYILLKAWSKQKIKDKDINPHKIYHENDNLVYEGDSSEKISMSMTAEEIVRVDNKSKVEVKPKRIESEINFDDNQHAKHKVIYEIDNDEDGLIKRFQTDNNANSINDSSKTKTVNKKNEYVYNGNREIDNNENIEEEAKKEADIIANFIEEHFDLDKAEESVQQNLEHADRVKRKARKHPFLSKKQLLQLIDQESSSLENLDYQINSQEDNDKEGK